MTTSEKNKERLKIWKEECISGFLSSGMTLAYSRINKRQHCLFKTFKV